MTLEEVFEQAWNYSERTEEMKQEFQDRYVDWNNVNENLSYPACLMKRDLTKEQFESDFLQFVFKWNW